MEVKALRGFQAIDSEYRWECGDGCCSESKWLGRGTWICEGECFIVYDWDIYEDEVILTDYNYMKHKIYKYSFNTRFEITKIF